MRARLALVVLVAAAAAPAAGCGDDDDPARSGAVRDIRLPTAAEREVSEKLHEAEVFLAAGKERLAEPLLRRVLELDPSNARACEELAQCLIRRGRIDEAAPLLERALRDSPRAAALRALHVQALMNLGDFARAEAAARAWTGADASSADAWFDLGRSLYGLGRYDDAVTAFRRAETLKAARADIRSELGLALVAAGHLGKAEAKFRDALDRKPEDAETWFRLGDVISRRGPERTKEAIDAMAKAVEIDPSLAVAHLYLYRLCRTADVPDGDPVRARGEEAWKAVLRLHGRSQTAASVGRAGAEGEPSEYSLREQASLSPDDPAPRVALARRLHAERRLDEAVEAYRGAVERGASDPATLALYASVLAARGDAAGAEQALASATESGTAEPSVLRLRAWVLLLLGRDADAIAAADAALAAAPGDVLAKKVRALATMHSGDVDAGLRELAALGWL